jgi:hypothetical protein
VSVDRKIRSSKIDREIEQKLGKRHLDEVVREEDRETKTSEAHPGMDAPMQYELDVGRSSEGYKPLYWSRLLAQYKKDARRREDGDDSALQIRMSVRHASDDQSPYEIVDWANPEDTRGATAFARQLVKDGQRHGEVVARAYRRSSRRTPVTYILAKFRRD